MQADGAFDRWKSHSTTLSPHILSSTWQVPLAWFVPFIAKERWLVLGGHDESAGGGPTTATPVRTLIYVTPMAQARRRVARALAGIRRHAEERLDLDEVESVGRWLEEFHPHSLVELDYGGPGSILDDAALRGDQSVAEVAAASGYGDGAGRTRDRHVSASVSRWRVAGAIESGS